MTQVNNGHRYIIDLDVIPTDLRRDFNMLLTRYKNLSWSLFHRYSRGMTHLFVQEEVRRWVDDQFIKLVKEYDVQSKVATPGYIKTKLSLRVKEGYVKKNNKYKHTVPVGVTLYTVEYVTPQLNVGLEENELLKRVFDDTKLTEVQSELLKELLINTDDEDKKFIVSTVANLLEVERSLVSRELTPHKDDHYLKINAYHGRGSRRYFRDKSINTQNHVWEVHKQALLWWYY
ncbi:sigma factor [Staphylococcus phage vB_SauH_DELF3]|nr:sigma factor [Staphylococcus phage vB_SauH_DELF3]